MLTGYSQMLHKKLHTYSSFVVLQFFNLQIHNSNAQCLWKKSGTQLLFALYSFAYTTSTKSVYLAVVSPIKFVLLLLCYTLFFYSIVCKVSLWAHWDCQRVFSEAQGHTHCIKDVGGWGVLGEIGNLPPPPLFKRGRWYLYYNITTGGQRKFISGGTRISDICIVYFYRK